MPKYTQIKRDANVTKSFWTHEMWETVLQSDRGTNLYRILADQGNRNPDSALTPWEDVSM